MGVGIDFRAKQFGAALLLALTAACSAAPGRETPDMPDVKPGDNAVIKAAWDAWGMRGFDRPTVSYVEGAGLNCTTTLGPGFLMLRTAAGTLWAQPGMEGAECDLGLSWPDEYAMSIAWDGTGKGVTLEAIVHELCHFAQGDGQHQGACKPGEGGQIAAITAQLRR